MSDGITAYSFMRKSLRWFSHQAKCILQYSTERNDGLNYGTERFLKLKPAVYRC